VDLETGAIVNADVRPGNEHDTADLASELSRLEVRVTRALGGPEDARLVKSVIADMGYFKTEEIALLQELEFRNGSE
jgi:hypothetical protein